MINLIRYLSLLDLLSVMAEVSIAKMDKGNDVTFKVKDEDISVLYIVKHELAKMDDVKIAGVAQRHYLINEYEFRVTTDENKDIFDAIRHAVDDALNNLRSLRQEVDSSLQKGV